MLFDLEDCQRVSAASSKQRSHFSLRPHMHRQTLSKHCTDIIFNVRRTLIVILEEGSKAVKFYNCTSAHFKGIDELKKIVWGYFSYSTYCCNTRPLWSELHVCCVILTPCGRWGNCTSSWERDVFIIMFNPLRYVCLKGQKGFWAQNHICSYERSYKGQMTETRLPPDWSVYNQM